MGVQLGSAYGKIVIDGSGVRKGTDEAKRGVTSLNTSFSNLARGLATGSAILGGVGALLKKTFDLAEQGASVLQTAESFETLIDTVGAAPDLLDQLRRASRGTISDLDLMSSTTTLLMGAQGELATSLANATPALMEMAMAAAKLNPALGDATFMYESLAKGIKRGSPMILDNLGIIVKDEEANRAYAESIGKAADELTAEEQKIALLNAVLAQGETLMAQAGGTTESLTDSYTQMGAAISNTKDEFLGWLGTALEPAANGLTALLTYGDRVNEMLAESTTELINTGASYDTYLQKVGEALVVTGQMSQAQQETYQTLLKDVAAVDAAEAKYGQLTREKIIQLVVTGQLTEAEGDYLIAALDSEQAANDLASAVGLMSAAEYEASTRTAELYNKIQEGPSYMSDLIASWEKGTQAMEDQSAAAADLNAAMDDLQTMVGGRLRDETEGYTEQQEDLAAKISEVQTKIEELSGQSALSADQQAELEGLQGDYAELAEQYAKNAEEHQIATKNILFDLLSQRAAVDGLSSAEMTVLTGIAKQWGLIDEQTAEAMSGFDNAFAILSEGGTVEDATNAILGIGEAAGVAADNVETELGDIDLTPTIESVAALLGQVSSIAGTHPLVFDVSVTGDSIPDGNWVAPRTRPVNELAANGLDMVVPAGYSEPHNPFLVGVSSGEHVQVNPDGRAGGMDDSDMGGIQIVQNFYGPAEPERVRMAAYDGGVLAASRRRGAR